MTRPFRFGVQIVHPESGLSWAETARRVEDAGFSTLVMPDHFEDQLAVGPALAVAAEATTDLRVGALVFGNDYRHPVILAKEMASVDVLSSGRMEFGIGAGWMRTDYIAAGMDYERPGLRIERMVEAIEIIRGLMGPDPVNFAGEHYTITAMNGLPKPIQSPPPLLIGGGGKRMLTIAAQQADIVGVTANLRAGEVGPDAVDDLSPEKFDEKLEWVRAAAGDRMDDIELNCLVMSTQITDDRQAALDGTGAMFGMDAETVGQTPILLIGSTDQIADHLRERRERWGFSYIIVQSMETVEALRPVVAELAGT
ncbi:MAG: TIGR03621 family F420-dependent LLM class oxidoreductase [Acidimicrobiales bacterium]|nr:TIGR03621 family F420-dependent LLM class oxidoreductase [Acidimicrobiales bacterium]